MTGLVYDSVVSVFMSDYQAITFESLDVGSSYLHIRYISSEYGSSSQMKVYWVKFKVTGAKKFENPYSRNVKLQLVITPVKTWPCTKSKSEVEIQAKLKTSTQKFRQLSPNFHRGQGVKKCEIWLQFSTMQLPLRRSGFEMEQNIGKLKHMLGSLSYFLPNSL